MAPRRLPAVPAARRARPAVPATRPLGTRTGSSSAVVRPARAGFVLYVGLSGEDATGHAADLAEVAESLRDLARDLLPTAETYTALSLVPGGGSDDVRDLRDQLSRLQPLERAAAADAAPTPVAETA
ncbi:MAG TPA: hypothetical protein VGC57_14295 [Cellulomonas sp.]